MQPTEFNAFVIGGVGLGAIALIGEIATWFSEERERHELLMKIETGAANQSGKMELLAIVQAITMRPPAVDEAIPVPAVQFTDSELRERKEEVEELRERLRKELAK